MKAVILAGGRGKRLKPITDYIPKPLIPINNIPILEWQIRYFKKFGIKEFIICAGYKTELISDFLRAKKNFNVKIHLVKEKIPLGTAGAIKNIKKLIHENSFFVINGDIITNIDLKKLQLKQNALAAIPLQTKFGIMKVKDNKIIKFSEKKLLSESWMNARIYHLSKNIFLDLPKKGEIEKTTFPKYAKNLKLNVVTYENPLWFSIDSYKDIEDCTHMIKIKNYLKFVSA